MSYEKLNLKDGAVLTAAHIAHLESGIGAATVAAEDAADTAEKAVADAAAFLAPAIMLDASGDVVSITDAAARPVQSVVSTIEPSTGHDALHVYRTGKNLSELGTVTLTRTKTVTLGVPIPAGTYAMSAVVESTDTDSSYCNVHFLAESTVLVKRLFGRSQDGERKVQTMTFERDITSIIFYSSDAYASGEGDTATFADIQIEAGEVATDYEPFQGQTLTATLPETVYGGTMDWTSGVLTVTHDADGAELAEPRIIHLDSQTLETIKGYNAVWSNTGETGLTYVADTKTYIDNAIAAIAASIIDA